MIPVLISLVFSLVVGTTANSFSLPLRLNFESQKVLSPSLYSRVGRSVSTYPSIYSPPPSLPPSSSPMSYYASAPSAVPPSYYSSSSTPYSTGDRNAAITSFTRDIQHSNSDSTSFTTSNGISSSHNVQVVRGRPSSYQDQYGQTVQSDSSITMSGHTAYQSPEGMKVSWTWNADENGFSPQGDHLPKPVSLPPDYEEAHKQALLAAAQKYSSYSGSDGGYRGATNDPPTTATSYGSSISSGSNSFGKYGPPLGTPTSTSYTSYHAPMQQVSGVPTASQQQSGYGYYQ